jgi:hypothetical protein
MDSGANIGTQSRSAKPGTGAATFRSISTSRPETTISELGIAFDVQQDGDRSNLQYASHGAVQWKTQLAGATAAPIAGIPPGQAGIEITFSRENAVVLVVKSGRQRRVKDIQSLRQTLLDRVEARTFPPEYAVVTHVVDAESMSILISSGRNARFAASAEAGLSAGLLDLANVQAGLATMAATNLSTEIVAKEGGTPLFKLAAFKKGARFIGRKPSFGELAFEADPTPLDLAELAPTDLNP